MRVTPSLTDVTLTTLPGTRPAGPDRSGRRALALAHRVRQDLLAQQLLDLVEEVEGLTGDGGGLAPGRHPVADELDEGALDPGDLAADEQRHRVVGPVADLLAQGGDGGPA